VRFPSRWLPQLCALRRGGVDELVGPVDVWHHTQPSSVPVSRAREVATVFDCIYLRDEGFLSVDAAARMAESNRALVERSARVLVPSAFVADDVVRAFGVPREKLVVTPLGCDHVLRALAGQTIAKPREPFVLTVARVDPRKNHVLVLRALELLAREGLRVRWVVAGPAGFEAQKLDEELARSTVRDWVDRRATVGERELALLYATCSAFVFPSLDEGFGLPPLEAMACGAPVIASTAGSLTEVLGTAALLHDPRDEEALARALRRVLTDQELARELTQRSRIHAARFTWSFCARATREVYVQLAHAAARGPAHSGATIER
jgi:glycosyltransferase involved in cell wall biosynthesis